MSYFGPRWFGPILFLRCDVSFKPAILLLGLLLSMFGASTGGKPINVRWRAASQEIGGIISR
uniref:Uncharacterized protein n=1 Tax=Bradyrhizobium amphicarpaeae TaxID=1404768 RepID=A0A2U8PN32_9BRAD|nr:hypothetical protein CIT40_03520 [Bradyrhizobium amphicarpaeae]